MNWNLDEIETREIRRYSTGKFTLEVYVDRENGACVWDLKDEYGSILESGFEDLIVDCLYAAHIFISDGEYFVAG